MEEQHHKSSKVARWLLYHSGAQPTEPPKNGWLLAADRAKPVAESISLPDSFSTRFDILWRYKWWSSGAAALLLLIIGWSVAGAQLAIAQIGNTRVSLAVSDTELSQKLQKQLEAYKLDVQYTDGAKQQFPIQSVGFSLDKAQTVRGLRDEQHSLVHRLAWWRPVKQSLVLQSNPRALHAFIADNVTKSVQPSQDATLTISKTGEVLVTDAVAGKQYGLENPQISLLNHVAALQTTPMQIKTLTTNPAVTSQELTGSKVELEKILNQTVSFDIGSKTVKPTKSDIAAWLELTPNPKTKTVDVDINSGKVQQYITKIAKANIHPARDQVEVTRNDGTVSVIVAGVDGVDVTNKDAVATDVTNNLLAGKGLAAQLPISTTPFKTVSTSAYPKWIEVDLTNKRMYAYEQESLVKSFLVSAGAPKTPTVTGKFAIYSKYDQKDMRGNNVDGSKYFQPHVPWVNFFYKDYAIHGNYWRPTSYFGNINSSHGCVSTVPNDAAWVYDWAPIGTPVIVHT